jgi:HSP20 family molecular chaperone IbpA
VDAIRAGAERACGKSATSIGVHADFGRPPRVDHGRMAATLLIDEPVYALDVTPTASVRSTDEEFVVDVDVPGFDVDELAVAVVDRALRVQGNAPPRDDLLRPVFEFLFTLPALADESAVEAVVEDRELTIRTPVRRSRGAHPVEIATRS